MSTLQTVDLICEARPWFSIISGQHLPWITRESLQSPDRTQAQTLECKRCISNQFQPSAIFTVHGMKKHEKRIFCQTISTNHNSATAWILQPALPGPRHLRILGQTYVIKQSCSSTHFPHRFLPQNTPSHPAIHSLCQATTRGSSTQCMQCIWSHKAVVRHPRRPKRRRNSPRTSPFWGEGDRQSPTRGSLSNNKDLEYEYSWLPKMVIGC